MANDKQPVDKPLFVFGIAFVLIVMVIAYTNNSQKINLWASKIDGKTLEFYKAIGTFIAALIAAAIASIIQWRQHQTAEKQWRTAQQKLNFELFDRRFAVYSAVYNLQEDVKNTGNIAEAKVKFYDAVRPSEWLFSKEIFNYLVIDYMEDAIKHTEKLYSFKHSIRFKNEVLYNAELEIYQQWLDSQYPKIKALFAPYLTLNVSKIIL